MSIKQYCITTANAILENKIMRYFADCKITKKEFIFFSAQMHGFFAGDFEHLLETAIQEARKIGDEDLGNVLIDNLNDERGMDKTNKIVPSLSHNTWRKNYLTALNINLTNFTATDVTLKALEQMKDIRSGNSFHIFGAILLIENFTPVIYRQLRFARNHLFPEIFLDSETDTLEVSNFKKEARMYIDDHIIHDYNDHLPRLLSALKKYESEKESYQSIKKGIDIAISALEVFLHGIELAFANKIEGDIYYQ